MAGTDQGLTRLDRHLVYFEELRKIAFDQYRGYTRQSRDVTKGPATRAPPALKRKWDFRALLRAPDMKLKLTRGRKRLLKELGIFPTDLLRIDMDDPSHRTLPNKLP
ncbi:MAG: hypothetical protein JWM91_1453 [Rhodospirillales bacterium]|nr:hypothetical protein [Rhodospirillales bacterium]